MGDHELSGPGLPSAKHIDWIKTRLRAEPAPVALQYWMKPGGGRPGQTIHFIARHKHVVSILRDHEECLSNEHYDDNLEQLPGGVALLLGERSKQPLCWQLLARVLQIKPERSRCSTDVIGDIASQVSAGVLRALRANGRLEFNLIREYGFYIPYLCAERFIGLRSVTTIPSSVRLFTWGRNLNSLMRLRDQGADLMRLTPEMRSSHIYLIWAKLMFSQIFKNYGSRSSAIQRMAGIGAKAYAKQVALLFETTPFATEDTLYARLRRVEAAFSKEHSLSREDYEELARNLILEFVSSFHILIGIAFAKVIDTLNREKIDLVSFSKALEQPEGVYLLDKVLAEDPATTMLFRTAKDDLTKYGIKRGEAVCFLIDAASLEYAEGRPDRNVSDYFLRVPAPEERLGYLNFGPHEACPYSFIKADEAEPEAVDEPAHPCFGQFWARAVLKEMIQALAGPAERRLNLRPTERGAAVEYLLGVPDCFLVEIDP